MLHIHHSLGFTTFALTALVACSKPDLPTPTVVLISLDTLRPERLGVYGNASGTSPAIDALARDGVVFDDVLSVAPWTLPSHITIFTGLEPRAHGVRHPMHKLPDKVNTVAELLHAAGYRTAAGANGGFTATMLLLYGLLGGWLLGVNQMPVPWQALLLSVAIYVALPLIAGYLSRCWIRFKDQRRVLVGQLVQRR